MACSLVSAELFRAGAATFNRLAPEEHHTASAGLGQSLLVGLLYTGGMVVLLFLLSIVTGWFRGSSLVGLGPMPSPGRIVIVQAVTWILLLLSGWICKTLLATAVLPCRVSAAAPLAAAWAVYQALFAAAFFGAVYFGLEWT